MAETRLTGADRLGIAWMLAEQGTDGAAVSEFLAALNEGLAKGEADAVDLHATLRWKYRNEGGEALGALIELAVTGARLAAAEKLLARHAALLKTVLEADPQTEFAARIVLKKVADEAEALATA